MLELERWARETTKLWNGRFEALDRVLESEKKGHIKNQVRTWQKR